MDANRADMAAAQSARDLANSEARKSTVRLGKSLSEGQLQKAVGWQALKAERHEELMRQKHALRVQALTLPLTPTPTPTPNPAPTPTPTPNPNPNPYPYPYS